MVKKMNLLTRLLLGIVLGILLGSLGGWFSIEDSFLFVGMVRLFKTFNGLFSVLLAFLIPLIILSFVTVGLADLGKKANKLFGITLLLAYLSTILAGFCSYFIGNAILPHIVMDAAASAATGLEFPAFFSLEVPPVFGVMTALVLSFLLGIGMANIKGTSLLGGFKDLREILVRILGKLIIPLIPFYIAGMFCNIAAEGKLVSTAANFASLFILILVLQLFYIVAQYGVASMITRKNQFSKIKNALPAYMTALGTQSSAVTIPVALDCAYKNEVSKDVADFCVPICATINLGGDTIALVIGAIGLMLSHGMEVSLLQFAPFILMLGITMVAAPGVPGGGVMAALGLLSSMLGLGTSLQDLMIALHFSQDSFGTATNVTGDQALTLIVNHFDQKPSRKQRTVKNNKA